jgi:nifR3 family TIM-barrel protein
LRELGGLGLATTDLVLAGHLVSGTRKSRRLVETNLSDRPLSVQIFSNNRDELVAAAKWLEANDYGGVDINMGCPMAKINSQGGGARLLCDLENAQAMAGAVVDAVKIPVTVKMRIGWDHESIVAAELASAFEQVGVAAVTIHGRTRSQGFHGDVHLDAIRDAVQAVDSMPIIGNGDVRTVADALRMREFTGCAAVAIGRGAMLDPWIFKKIATHFEGQRTFDEPTTDEQVAFLVRHFSLMTEQHGEYSCVLFRKFAGWYGARLGIPEDLEDRLRRMESYSEFDRIIEQVRLRHRERESTTATALIKVPNGPIEHW